MRFLLALLLIGGAVALVMSRVATKPYEVMREGRVVKIRSEHMAARFSTAGNVSGEFMLFGANDQPSSFESAWLLLVEASDGRYLLEEYPDLRRCGSAGAEHFQRIAEGRYLIGANGPAHQTLKKAAALQKQHERDGDGRLCLELRGQVMAMDYVGLGDRDLTQEFTRLRRDPPYYLIDSASLRDCN